MPAVVDESGKIVATSSNTMKFTVRVNTVYVYKSPTSTTSKPNRAGTYKKTETFKAEAVEGKEGWYKILSGTYTGRYVFQEKTSTGYNFSSVADESGTTPAPSKPTAPTTEATTDDEGNPTTVDSDGNITNENGGSVRDEGYTVEMPDEFMNPYNGEYISTEEYNNYLNGLQNGLTITNLSVILGLPHQFLPVADARLDGTKNVSSIGRTYAEKIVKYMPIMFITPGVPEFMKGFSEEQRTNMLEGLIGKVTDAVVGADTLESDSYYGRYYSLKFAYVEYFKYVNAMLRSAALFLGIDKVVVNGKPLSRYNWLYNGQDHHINNAANTPIQWLGNFVGAIALYADCGNSVNDSFSNATGESNLASTLGSVSDTGRELNFLIGNVGSFTGLELDKLTGQEDLLNNMDTVRKAINDTMKGANIFTNILNKAQTILAGGRLVFPEIWTNSEFGRSYSCSMKLVSPSGSPLSIYLNILVPIYHLLGMCLPRESISQAYFSPFLLRCYYKGLFHVDMGIMTGLSVTKGSEAEWTYDGIPTVAEVSFEIKDLYQSMYMSRAEDEGSIGFLSNMCELDYIANSCGVNINDQEVLRSVKLWKMLKIDGIIDDFVYNNMFGSIIQFFNQKAYDMFAMFS